MKIVVPQHVFDEVRVNFMALDLIHVDEKIRDLLERFKHLPEDIASQIVPRWSCQGHSDESGDDAMYIIFMTRDNGFEILTKLMNYISLNRCIKHGSGTLAGTTIEIVNLMFNSPHNIYNNIRLASINGGDDEVRNRTLQIWNDAIDNLIEGTL